jgi:hypothetical protein
LITDAGVFWAAKFSTQLKQNKKQESLDTIMVVNFAEVISFDSVRKACMNYRGKACDVSVFENRGPGTAHEFIDKNSLLILSFTLIRRMNLKLDSEQKFQNLFFALPSCQTACCTPFIFLGLISFFDNATCHGHCCINILGPAFNKLDQSVRSSFVRKLVLLTSPKQNFPSELVIQWKECYRLTS